jgi:hypothetical protein
MEGAGICFPVQLHECARELRIDVIWVDGQHAVDYGFFLPVASKIVIAESGLLQQQDISRVEIDCALKIA